MRDDPNSKDSDTKKIGSGMTIAAWIFILAIATLYFDRFLDERRNPNQNVEFSEGDTGKEVILQRNRQGHYLSSGEINGEKVSFLLDTGATDVSIPTRIADALQLQRGMQLEANTANGKITVYMTRLDEIQIGNIVLYDVRASINDYMDGDEILLGMTFLKHLEFTQRGEQLILRQYN
jgi:aspartyl protease family protein